MQRQRSTVIQTSSVSGGQTRNAARFNEPKANSAFEFMSNCFYNNLGLSMTVKKKKKNLRVTNGLEPLTCTPI